MVPIAAALLVWSSGVPLVTGCAPDGWGRAGAEPPPSPPAGADDASNRAILIEGGIPARRRDGARSDTIRFGPRSTHDEQSYNHIRLADFWMQQHEVTNEEYADFDPEHVFPDGEERHPVANVTWEGAMYYAASLGGSLPTEAQWQFAAEGREGRRYPWGDSEPTCDRAHYKGCRPEGTVEVMSRPGGATPEGVHDLAGNVWEWVTPNWFEPGVTPVNDASRRLRGGSFDSEAFFLRARNRSNDFFEGFKHAGVGFRVVWPSGRGRD